MDNWKKRTGEIQFILEINVEFKRGTETFGTFFSANSLFPIGPLLGKASFV
jgi:hypothetical protein